MNATDPYKSFRRTNVQIFIISAASPHCHTVFCLISSYLVLHCLLQALFGRTDGMYTRAMLLSGLKSQKALSGRLEKLMVAQTVELEECKEIIDK